MSLPDYPHDHPRETPERRRDALLAEIARRRNATTLLREDELALARTIARLESLGSVPSPRFPEVLHRNPLHHALSHAFQLQTFLAPVLDRLHLELAELHRRLADETPPTVNQTP